MKRLPCCLEQILKRGRSWREYCRGAGGPAVGQAGVRALPAADANRPGRHGQGLFCKADDTKIGRDAAIKVSPTELGPDWERRQPFHREVYKNHRDQMSSAEEMTRK
jgi:hypothetical protein